MGSDSDSDSEDETAGIQAQVATMLGPFNRKLKKANTKIEKLELTVESLKRFSEEGVPALRKELLMGTAELASRLERLQSEIALCASKTSLEVARQEQNSTEQRLRTALEEARSKLTAQEMMIQGLETRLATMDSSMRASELKYGNELAATTAQFAQLNAALERQRGEADARLSEMATRASSQHDSLLSRLEQAEDEQRKALQMSMGKVDLVELHAMLNRRADEGAANLEAAHAQWRVSAETVESLQSAMRRLASLEALDKVNTRVEAIAEEMRSLVGQSEAAGRDERTRWEDKLMQRQHGLEAAAQESRRDWHRLAAQLEQLQTYCSERALRAEHDQLVTSVEALRESAATKAALEQVEATAKAAAGSVELAIVEAEVRSLQASVRAEAASTAEALGRMADANELAALDERLQAVQGQLDLRMGTKEAHFAIGNKLDKGFGEAMNAELQATQERLSSLVARANESDATVSQAGGAMQLATAKVSDLQATVDELRQAFTGVSEASHRRDTDVHDLVRAVRALTCDAEMRCSLDEREMEFLWAAPGHIYGQHGWRPNNGSKSERTPYPAGNFKVATRHGSEGHARDVMERRKKWLNSITLGAQAVEAEEMQAIAAGVPQPGNPIRLPDIDEFKRKAPHARPDSAEGGVLGPAHALIARHSSNVGGGVGLSGGPAVGRHEGSHPNRARTRMAVVDPSSEVVEPWTAGMGSAAPS